MDPCSLGPRLLEMWDVHHLSLEASASATASHQQSETSSCRKLERIAPLKQNKGWTMNAALHKSPQHLGLASIRALRISHLPHNHPKILLASKLQTHYKLAETFSLLRSAPEPLASKATDKPRIIKPLSSFSPSTLYLVPLRSNFLFQEAPQPPETPGPKPASPALKV